MGSWEGLNKAKGMGRGHQRLYEVLRGWIAPSESVLDIGCGSGELAWILGEGLGCVVWGTDQRFALKRAIPTASMADIHKLGFASKSFDVGLFCYSLHHVPLALQRPLLQDALRVCGRILVIETAPTLAAKIVESFWGMVSPSGMPRPMSFRSPEEWAGLCAPLGTVLGWEALRPEPVFGFRSFLLRVQGPDVKC